MMICLKRIVTCALCAVLLIGALVACRKDDSTPTSSGSAGQETTETTDSTGSDSSQNTEETTVEETEEGVVEEPTEETSSGGTGPTKPKPSKPSGGTGPTKPNPNKPSDGTDSTEPSTSEPSDETDTTEPSTSEPTDSDSDDDTEPSTEPSTSPTVNVTGVALNAEKLSLKPGDTGLLFATVYPEDADNQTVIWSSSNSAVASVSQNGNITAHKVGAARITVVTEDGDYAASCLVAVTSEALSASAEYDIFFRNGVAAFEMIISADGGTEEYTYSTKVYRNGILEATKTGSSFVHIASSGAYKVEITVVDSGGNKVILGPISIE